VVAEGEPDFLTRATLTTGAAVVGVHSGAWTADHAAAVPTGTRVIVRTDRDDAGERYACEVLDSLKHRCAVWR
jgi:DNA primase